MKIDGRRMNKVLAEQCKSASDLRGMISPATITRIRQGRDIGTKTAGKLAKALSVPIEHLIEQEA